MKKGLKRFLTLLLAASMLLASCAKKQTPQSEESDTDTDIIQNEVAYYAKYGADGDGRSISSPAGSLGDIIDAVNADGYKAGDEVKVYIMCADGEPTDNRWDSREESVFLAYPDKPEYSHSAKIIYTSYESTKRSTLVFENVWTADEYDGLPIFIMGPTVFDNLKIIDNSNSGNSQDIFAQGHELSVTRCDMYKLIKENGYWMSRWGGKIYAGAKGDGVGNIGNGATVNLPEAAWLDSAVVSGYATSHSQGSATIKNDVTVRIGNGNLQSLVLDGSKEGVVTSFGGNVNIVLNNTDVQEYSTANIPSLKGVHQLIMNNGSEIANDAVSQYINADKNYILRVSGGGKLDVTDAVGSFSVEGSKIAYTLSDDGATVYYGKEILSVPAGSYSVEFAVNTDELEKQLEDPPPPDGMVFVGWQDNGDGTMTAKFSGMRTANYYVKDGATGNGKTPSTPAGFVSEVVATINADGLKAGETAVINIMERDNVLTLDKGKVYPAENSFTAWAKSGVNNSGIIPKHKATIIVTSYGYDGTDESMTHIAFSGIIGENANLIMSGPTIFKDIKLLWQRNTSDRPIYANGYELGLVNVRFMKTDADYYTGAEYTEVSEVTARTYINLSASATGCGTVLRLETPTRTDSGKFNIVIPGDARPSIRDIDEPSAIYFDNEGVNATIVWGNKYAFAFKKGLSIVANNCGTIAATKDSNLVTISGGLQIINNTSKSLPAIPDNVKYDALWVINTTSCKLDITDVPGTYKVPDGVVAVATDTVSGISKTSDNGILTLSAGTYTVYGIAQDELSQHRTDISFDGASSDTVYIKGTKVYLPAFPNTVLKNFIGWSDGARTYAPDDAYTVPNTAASLSAVWQSIDGLAYVYVSESGDDADSGTSESTPVKTLAKAVELVESMSGSVKKVIILGNYKYSGALPTSTDTIIYTGIDGAGSAIELYDDSILLFGNAVFERIKLYSTTTKADKFFDSNGYSITFGDEVASESGKTVPLCISALGNGYAEISAVLKSGNLGHVTVKGADSVNELNITVDGAIITTLKFVSSFNNGVRLEINNGIVGGVSVSAASFTDTLQIIVNNGIEVEIPESISASGGVWVIRSEKSDGCYLEFTDTVGNYTVRGGKAAIAANAEGLKFGSYDVLSLNSGIYTVQYLHECSYIYSGDKITVLKDTVIDLSQITPDSKSGYIFEGWKKNGAAVAVSASYVKGDVINACYIEYKEDDFTVADTDIATSPTNELQFVFEQKDSFTNEIPEIIETGALLLPTDKTWGRDMLYNTQMIVEWQWDIETRSIFTPKTYNGYMPQALAANSFSNIAGGRQYVISVEDIEEKDYYTFYSVKGYIRYRDLNGIERIVYSEYRQTNLYKAALEKIRTDGSTTELENIKYYVEVTRKELYMAENYDNRTLLHGYNSDGSVNDANQLLYRLKNGLNVREITVDTGKTGKDAVEIVMFADVHLNYINQKDIDLGEIRTLSTYRGRTWNRDGASINNINLAMEYASFFDKTVVCGDIMDYFSWGCAEISRKLIFDKDETVIATLGNHETAEVVQPDITELKGTSKYTLEEHYERLSGFWPNNVLYHSEIISNDNGEEMAMLVLMDNHKDIYVQEQYNKLSADIATAKQKDIPILIFQHKPICTKQSGTVNWFFAKGDYDASTHDWSDKFAGSSKSNAMTMSVYNLIVNNADVIRGLFCGDDHNHIYTEVLAKNSDGTAAVIPQHVVSANAFLNSNGTQNGNVLKITVK